MMKDIAIRNIFQLRFSKHIMMRGKQWNFYLILRKVFIR
nr:MAG TPA: hypothetical protein [Caudoviricetes sp.]